jgi:hypothetical protein
MRKRKANPTRAQESGGPIVARTPGKSWQSEGDRLMLGGLTAGSEIRARGMESLS